MSYVHTRIHTHLVGERATKMMKKETVSDNQRCCQGKLPGDFLQTSQS